MKGYIYMAQNQQNSKCYVGKTALPLHKKRLMHEDKAAKGSPLYFHNAIRKYGCESFDWWILESSIPDDELNTRESYHIRELRTRSPNGYNLTDGGDGFTGGNHSEETKARISEASKLQWADAEIRKKRIEGLVRADPWTGRKHTEEAKEKNRQAHLGRRCSAKTKEKISSNSKKMWGQRSEVERKRILVAATEAKLGKPRSDETKAKLSETLKRLWQDPEFRARQLAARKAKRILTGPIR